jgi:hypothetical protein
MLDRQKLEAILTRRFPGVASEQIAAAANAIMGLGEEWEEALGPNDHLGHRFFGGCGDVCFLAREVGLGAEFRLFRRRRGA